jgi:hypothetical protein
MESGAVRARRVVVAVLAFAAVFEAALYITKEAPAIYDHAPWLNDPYDVAVSFALFCVPLIGVPSGLRLLAGRRESQAPQRLADLIRACGVALAVIATTLAACWAAVAQGANRPAWTSATAIQVIGLVLLSAGSVAGAVGLRMAAAALSPGGEVAAPPSAGNKPHPPDAPPLTSEANPDWLGDLVDAGRLMAGLCGPARRPPTQLLDWADHRIVPVIRRHPVGTAAVLSAAVGMLVAISQSVSEGLRIGVAGLFFGIGTSGVFAFLVVAGWYLRFVRSGRTADRAPVLRAIVLAAAAVPVALAFRAALWPLLGMRPQDSGLPALCLLLGAAALLVFVASLAAERVARSRRAATPPR